MTDLHKLSDREVTRWYSKVYRRIRYQGADMFGLDWATIRLTHPHKAAVLSELHAEIRRRKL